MMSWTTLEGLVDRDPTADLGIRADRFYSTRTHTRMHAYAHTHTHTQALGVNTDYNLS